MKNANLFILTLFVLIISGCGMEDYANMKNGTERTARDQTFPVRTEPALDQSNNIRNYLMRVAGDVTHRSRDGINTLQGWKDVRDKRYREFLDMMGLTDVPVTGERPPLNVNHVGTVQQDGFRIEKLYYESLPDLYVPANLYVPDDLEDPAPAILYTCGHSGEQKADEDYQAHARKFARLGFVCLIIETIQFGEVRGDHWGPYAQGRFHWYSRGYTPGGVELWNGMRGIDLLTSREEVDPDAIGTTGISGGGAYSWYLAAADRRIQASAPVCGTGTVAAHAHQRTIDDHCDCMMPINTKRIDYRDIGALIAPRPLLIAAANRDQYYSIESVRQTYEYVKEAYDLYDAGDRVQLVETPGDHSYHRISRTRIFSFFTRHLMGKEISPEEIGDINTDEEDLLSAEKLKVYVDGPPEGDRTTTIQQSFQEMADSPELQSMSQLRDHREEVRSYLREHTFGHIPEEPVDLSVRKEFRADALQDVYSFVPETGFRLRFEIQLPDSPSRDHPVVLVLRNPNEKRGASKRFSSGVPEEWKRAYFAARGIGDSGWSPALQWHVRRMSAWTGRTVASMRVYDVLRCLRTMRRVEGISDDRIAIAARGEMAAVALYAALLDGNVHALLLQDPPPTQNAKSRADGRGEAIEMLNVLRVTDLPQVAGLLYPTNVRFLGEPHENYRWAQDTLERLNQPDAVQTLESIKEWTP